MLNTRSQIIESVRLRLRERRRLLVCSVARQSGLDEHIIDDHRLPLGDLMMLGPLARELDRIDQVLDQIRNDRYGVCEDCAASIVSERLEMNPLSRFCVDCQVKRDLDWRRTEQSPVLD